MIEEIKEICKKVSEKLGKGYAECVYQEGVCVELRERKIKYSKEATLEIKYDGVSVGSVRADIIIEDKYIIECKAIESDLKINHVPQLICYMRLTGISEGIIVNFNQHPGKKPIDFIYAIKTTEDNIQVVLLVEPEKYLDFTINGNIL
jgi:GxxExxY protein